MINIYNKYRKLLTQSKYILWLNITDKIFWFATLLLIARNYSIEIYGQTVTIIAFCTIFITIFDLGLPIYLQREVAVNKLYSSELFSRIFLLSIFLFLLYFIVSSIFYYIIYFDIPFSLFVITSVMIYISSLNSITAKALNGLNEFKQQFNIFFGVRLIIALLLIPALYFYKSSTELILLTILIGFFVNLILNLTLLNKYSIKTSINKFSIKNGIKIIKISFPLGLAVLFNFLYDKIDLILISKLTNYNSAGYYNAAYGIYKTSSIIFSFLLVAGFTKVSEMKNDYIFIKQYFIENFKLITIICFIASLVLIIFANEIINLLYSEKFVNSVFVLRILAIGIIAIGLNNLTGIIINAMGYFKIVMYITLYGMIFNIVLNIIYIPIYGIAASGVISVLTEILIFGTEYYFLNKLLKENSAK